MDKKTAVQWEQSDAKKADWKDAPRADWMAVRLVFLKVASLAGKKGNRMVVQLERTVGKWGVQRAHQWVGELVDRKAGNSGNQSVY
jgi:hypothetical protein